MGSSRINAVRQRIGAFDFTEPLNKNNELGRRLRRKRIDDTQPHIGRGKPYKRKGKVKKFTHTLNTQSYPQEIRKKGTLDVEGKPVTWRDKSMGDIGLEDPEANEAIEDLHGRKFGLDDPEKFTGEELKEMEKQLTPPALSNYTGRQPAQDWTQQTITGEESETPSFDVNYKRQTEEQKYIENPQHKIKPIKPTRMEWRAIISAKSARIQMARERLGAVGAIDLQSILLKHTGRARKMKGKHFLTTGGVLTKPFEMHRNVLADSKVGHDVQEFLRNTGALRIKSDIRFQEGLKDIPRRTIRDDGISSDPDAWLEIETEKKITPKQLNTINKHIKRYDIPENHITLIDSSPNSEATNQFPRGIATVKPENMMKRRRATHTKNIIDQLQNEKYPSQEQLRESKLRQRIAGLGFRERILNWLKEQPRFKSFDPDSSFVGTVKYDQDNQSMQIELNGKKYDFCNVEERLFDSFSGAGSKGAFFNREIKSLHNCGAW